MTAQDRPRTDQVAPSPGPGTGIHQASYSGITTHGPAAFGDHNIVNQVSYRSAPPTHADDVLVSKALEALAGQVETERRRDEERSQVLRRPLPVRWAVTAAAGSAMADVDWSSIGVTDDQLPAGGLDDLAGLLARRLPHRRLVILGTAGAGKTVLATRLVRGLLRERLAGQPVPVLLPADTWHPGEQHLREWMAQRLTQDHPHLGTPAPGRSRTRRTMATHLIESRLVLPVLDGLDMIGDGLLGTALSELNSLGAGEPLVVTSRIEPYEGAVRIAGCGLSGAAVVEVLPLRLTEVRDYLAPAGGTGRWHRAFAELANEPDAPLAQALRTPLMAWLARTSYPTASPTTVTADPATTVADPHELGDRARFPGRDAIADHLIDGLLPAVYPAEPTPTGRRDSDEQWHRQEVERALIFLARHLRRTDTHEIAWWRLDRAVRHQRTLWIPLLGTLYGLFFGLGHSLTAGLAMGTVMGLVGTSRRARTKLGWVASETPYRTKVSFRRLRVTLWHGLVSATKLVVPLLAGLVLLSMPEPGPLVITAGVLLLVTTAVLLVRQTWPGREHDPTRELVVPADPSRAVSPTSTLRGDRAAGLMVMPPVILFGVPPAILFDTVRPMMVATAFTIGWIGAGAWARYTVARAVLAARGHLPWRTMAFLDDAVDRGVLRRVGATYQFRHPRLRDRLAEHPR
ncbi:hypothetical protein AB0B63_08535 [Micromonospora sp. NPDC049081]|uniref:hypothetical protein n=1 Tax=Micromonospora sp. NPDC049081 TaxID=3155150 RepID=UPI0033D10F06